MNLILTCLLLIPQSHEKELKPVSFVLGVFEGEGRSGMGAYKETMTTEWGPGKQTLILRSRSTAGSMTVFEDLRIISYDNKGKKLRMRQWAMGDLAEYDVEVKDDGKTLVFTETSHEGRGRPEWRYTWTRKGDDSFSYVVETKRGDRYSEYVSGSLTRKTPDTGQLGRHPYGHFAVRIPWKNEEDAAAQIHYPKEADGPFPVIVLSPGGQAATYSGYDGFGRWFASWGYVTVIIAFDTDTAAERADLYSEALDWLEKKNAEDGWRLKGKLDTKKFVAAGHSRGGSACVSAATQDARFVACLALAPSGPKKIEGEHTPQICLISGDQGDEKVCNSLYEQFKQKKTQVTIEGMDHFFNPGGKSALVLKYATAFLNARVKGETKYGKMLSTKASGIQVRSKK